MLQCPVCLRDKNGKPTAAVGTATVPGSNVTKIAIVYGKPHPPEPDGQPTLRLVTAVDDDSAPEDAAA